MTSRVLTIKRFKCFKAIKLRFENLTILTGKNSSGKSTITQAVRLLRYAALADTSPVHIHLNSNGLLLGTFDEILNRGSEGITNQSFEIGLSHKKKQSTARFKPAEKSDECEYVETRSIKDPFLSDPSSCYFTYLSAERNGPRLHQPNTDGHRNQKVGVGIHGEFSAEVLTNNYTTRLDEKLIHPDLITSPGGFNALVNPNLEKWMSTIIGDIEIRATRPPRLAMPMLEYRTGGNESEWQFPTNHGFGVSYTLPIVLACLLSEENGIVVVDSPEAHLHPAAQTALAMFLARVAACGRTVIIETHSDHIVDGARLSIADRDHPISADDCVFHYLGRTKEGDPIHFDLSPRSDGSFKQWPKGFFDQISSNLSLLSKMVSKKNDP